MAAVQLRTLGECTIETDRARLDPDAKVAFGLGLYLIVERGKRIPRQLLIDIFWPDDPDGRFARHRFRQALLRLRQLGIPIAARQEHLWLERDAAEADFDALLHTNGDAEAMIAGHASLEFLPGYAPRISERFGSWLELHRSRVHTAAEAVFLHALHAARARGDWPAVERIAIACLLVDPYNEEATMARAEATVMRGSKKQALAILDSYMDALGERTPSIGLPARILRARIADRVHQPRYATLSEKYFVGRDAEVAQLTALIDSARTESGGGAVVWGPPGIGKSRLVQEIATAAELKGVRVVTARCQPTHTERPLSVFIDSTPVLRALPGGLGVSPHSVSLLQRLTGQPTPEAELPGDAADGGVRSAAMRRALFDLFDAVAHENTLVFVVEDVHWADRQSLAMLSRLAEWSVAHPVAVLATSRNLKFLEHLTDIPGAAAALRPVQLAPLSSVHAEELLTQLASDQSDTPPPQMVTWCTRVAEGNPYYLRELLTRWLETHEPFGVPKSLEELVERRVANLSAEALRLLQICVTFGDLCTLARLEAVGLTTGPELLAALEELGASGVVVCDAGGIRVRHELLTEAAREKLSDPSRRLMHRRVATVLEAENVQEPVPAVLWDCAHHWESAGEPERGVGLLDLCGKHLLRVGLPQEAAELYKKAFTIRVPTVDQRLRLHEGLISALRLRGLWSQVLAAVRQLYDEIRSTDHRIDKHSSFELTEIEATWRTGSASEALLERLYECVACASASITHRLNAAFWIMALGQNLGRGAHATRTWRLVEPLVASKSTDPIARTQVAMVYHTDYGDLHEAVVHAELLVDHTRRTEDPIALIRALRNASVALRRAGHSLRCKAFLIEAFDTATRYHAALGASDTAHQLAAVLLQEGDVHGADAWLATAETLLSAYESQFQDQDVLATRVRLAVALGDLTKAERGLGKLRHFEDSPSLRQRQEYTALRLALGTAVSPPDIDCTLLPEAERMYRLLGGSGHQDFPVETLVAALSAVNEPGRSRKLLREYLWERRRDHGPLSPLLRTLSESLAVDAPMPKPVYSERPAVAAEQG